MCMNMQQPTIKSLAEQITLSQHKRGDAFGDVAVQEISHM